MNLAWVGFCRKSKGRDFMKQTFDMKKLGVGNEEEWKKVFPILFAQANEVLKTILDFKDGLDNQMIIFDSIKYSFRKIKLRNNPDCKNKC